MNSFIPWVGGKRLLRKYILSVFPPGVGRYIEVFGGAGWVLFAREKHAEMEVYNDLDGNLMNLLRCIKYHCEELQRELTWSLNAREFFKGAYAQLNAGGLTDIQRAARFFLLVKLSFGADLRTFGCVAKNLMTATDYFSAIQKRLEHVVIENLDFEHVIKTYDRPNALFYVDPPYYNAEKYYGVPFKTLDHERLKYVLTRVKGLFILSYNDDPYIRQLYSGYRIREVSRDNSLVKKDGKTHTYRELIITSF